MHLKQRAKSVTLCRMNLKTIQYCTSDGFMTLVKVPSHTTVGKFYEVLVQDINYPADNICECPGYTYRGRCVHQLDALNYLCMWDEIVGPEKQTQFQITNNICPRCGGETESETIADDDEKA